MCNGWIRVRVLEDRVDFLIFWEGCEFGIGLVGHAAHAKKAGIILRESKNRSCRTLSDFLPFLGGFDNWQLLMLMLESGLGWVLFRMGDTCVVVCGGVTGGELRAQAVAYRSDMGSWPGTTIHSSTDREYESHVKYVVWSIISKRPDGHLDAGRRGCSI